MPLILPGNVASATASTTYNVDNSCRFDDGDTAWMEKDSSSVAEKKIGTISFWMKRGNLTTAQTNIITHNDTGYCLVALIDGHQIRFYSGEHDLSSTQKLRDPAAWYHIFANWDTTQGVAANRAKLYVNGVQVTAFATETYPDQNDELPFFVDSEAIVVGRNSTGANYFDGYLAEVVVLEGTAAAVTDFGEFNSDSPNIWQPIEHAQSGNKGANGFYLDFKASDNLGNDAYGGTDFDETDLAAIDQCVDTPTNNFCTWNSGADNLDVTLSQGSCTVAHGTNLARRPVISTFGVSAGKWYWEWLAADSPSGGNIEVGIVNYASPYSQGNYLGQTLQDDADYTTYLGNGIINVSGTTSDSGTTYTGGDVIGVAVDIDNEKIYFYKDNTLVNDGGTDYSGMSAGSGFVFMANGDRSGGAAYTASVNFGNPVADLSSAANDENGYGNFEFAPPSGFLALCTKNLGSSGG